jgi:putative MATE family efflux protein
MAGPTENEITEGSLLKALVSLASPLLLQNFIQVAQLLIDLFWLGRFHAAAVAALGLVYPLTGLLFSVTTAIPFIGTQVLVSQRVGSDDQQGARRATFTGLTAAVGLSVTFGLFVAVVAGPAVNAVTSVQPQASSAEVVQLAAMYVTVLALGVVFASTGDVMEASFVARGDSRVALYLSVVTVIANAILDPFLIFGYGPVPRLGVKGAALATVGGYLSSLAMAIAFAASGRAGGVVSRTAAAFERSDFRELFDIGYPKAAQSIARRTGRMAVVSIVFATGGAVGLSAYIVGTRVSSVASIPAFGFQQATQSIVGQNLGADQPERANDATWLSVAVTAGILGVIAVIQWSGAGFITTVVAPELQGAGYSLAVQFLRILALSYPALGAVYVLQGGFNGARRTRVSFVTSLAQYWGVQLVVSLVAGVWLGVGVIAVFWSITASNVVAAIGLGLYYWHASGNGMNKRAAKQATDDTDSS